MDVRAYDEAVDLAAQQVLDQPGLELGVAAGLADEQQVPLLQRRGQAPRTIAPPYGSAAIVSETSATVRVTLVRRLRAVRLGR